MARPTGTAKKPGRFKQYRQVYTVTRRADPRTPWLMLLGLVVGIGIGVALAFLLSAGSVLIFVLYVVLGLALGALLALIVLTRLAERAAYKQIEGQPGAVGAVLRGSLRRGWRGSEVPVAVNGRTRDAVYRAVGRPGVVLIAEGPKGRTQRMVEDERRKVARVAPNVPVNVLQVGPDAGSVKLSQINRRLGRLKPRLTRAEVLAVANRLESMRAGGGPAIPRGVDPTRLRPVRR